MNTILSRITAVGRTIDPRCATNLAIALLSAAVVLVAVIARLVAGAPILDAILRGVGAGFSVFFAWALSRELDPDHDLSAFVGAGLMLVALLLADPASLLLLLWLMLVLRVVNRTTGLTARPLDSLAVLGLGAWLTWQLSWAVGLVTALALLLDGLLAPRHRAHLWLSAPALLAAVLIPILRDTIAMAPGPTPETTLFALLVSGLFLVVIATSGKVRSVGDETGTPLNPVRVQAAQSLALLATLLFVFREGAASIVALGPAWAAMLGVALFRIGMLAYSRLR
jgi:hypothetical protein